MKFSAVYRYVLVSAVALCVGFAFGYFIPYLPSKLRTSGEMRVGSGKYTNALLECEIARDSIAVPKKNFSKELEEFVEELITSDTVADIAVYYRDLNNGPVISYNQDDSFAPASLLKVPLLITYLYWDEQQPGLFEEVLFFEKPFDVGYVQEFPPEDRLVVGRSYTIRELLERAVVYSDNQAYMLLYNHMPQRYFSDLFTLLGIDPAVFMDSSKEMTVREYSSFFRILYNVSFLSFVDSEYALSLLTKITFKDGLNVGVPEDIAIAHKFGERKNAEGMRQFHDCGIVYYPKYPYLLCVMTQGENTPELITAIQKVSAFVYKQIDSEYGME